MFSSARRRMTGLVATAFAVPIVPLAVASPTPVAAASPDIVISEVYGGGGNSGATYTHDFIELFNRGGAPVDVSGWSVQYASATGTGTFQSTPLTGTIPPGGHYLVQQAAGSGGTTPLPTPDATGSLALSGTVGKVIVARQATGLACNGGSTACSAGQLAAIVDLVGWGTANFAEGTAAPATTNATSTARRDRCVDSDDNATDFATGEPTPQSSATAAAPCDGVPTDAAPTVVSIAPPNGAAGVAVDSAVAVTFSEAVAVGDGGIGVECASTGVIDGTVTTADSIVHTFDPTPALPHDDACTVTVAAAAVTDVDPDDPPDVMASDATSSFTTALADPCAAPVTPIPAIQGGGDVSPVAGTVVTTRGVVVSDDEGPAALSGFTIQDPLGDGDAATSDGIFVFTGAAASRVSNGDDVIVRGTVIEFNGLTEISPVQTIAVCGTGTVAPTDVALPFADVSEPERYEGMLVRLPQTLTVTDTFTLARFGEVSVSSGGRLPQPTNIVEPGPAALAQQAANDRNRVVIDDNSGAQNPAVVRHGRGGEPLSASNTLRGGDTVTGVVGVLTSAFDLYRVHPFNALGGGAPNFEPANARPVEPPDVGGRIQVAGMNVLNYFNTINPGCTAGVGGAPIDCRGAETPAELDRQVAKTVAAIVGTGAEVIGVNEIENDGYGPDSALAHLVDALNAATAPGTYAYVDADAGTGQINALGSDAIKVAIIYQPAAVAPAGTTAVLNTAAFVTGGDSGPRNRPALAQAFTERATGATFTTVVNHLKSKGSTCDAPDAGDGQGNCNDVRVRAVELLIEWLDTDPTGTGDDDYLLVGDLNAYAREDPITRLAAAGYTNLVDAFVGAGAYSYSFGGQWGYLDHAIGSPTIVDQVTGVGEWHINSDEPVALDYNTNFKSPEQVELFYAPDQYRTSDHDPAIVGLDLTAPGTGDVIGAGTFTSPAGSVTAKPAATGRTSFALLAHTTGRGTVAGALALAFPAARLTVVGTGLSSPVVVGETATITGAARVNGIAGSTFEATVTDGRPDRVHLIVRDRTGAITYDSGDQPIATGSVVIVPRR